MNIKPSFGRLIRKIYLAGEIYIGSRMENLGIGRGQFHILMAIFRQGAETQTQIAEILGTDKSSVARTIVKLVDSGIIERHRQEENRRAYKIAVTQKGLLIQKEIKQVFMDWTERITHDMTEEEKDLFLGLLDRAYENVREIGE